ncbi:MAG TPA: PP2C family protein-serine/threonine phosphatase [Candidatus Angelobacter sp.]|nr:PP2C family protein-serine/threonine phosphatase [Candidatus Angelobacter sp.]
MVPSPPTSVFAFLKSAKPQPSGRETAQAQAPELKEAQLAAAFYGQRTRGDLHDYIRVSPSRVLFALLDVAGRMEQNRAVLAAVQSTFRACGPQLLVRDDTNEADAMIEISIQLNRAILRAAGKVSCTAFAACYNESLGTVCYVNAGHTPGLLRDESGVAELGATGLPMGLFSHSTPDASIVAIQPGAALLLVSRGMVEARRKNTEFGLSQVKNLLSVTPEQSAQKICAAVLAGVGEFLSQKAAQNDITAIALVRSSAGKSFAAAG